MADLKAVKHVAIRQQIWEEYCNGITYTGLNGYDLRIDLREFPGLETVMLVHGGKEDRTSFYTSHGHIEIEDKVNHPDPNSLDAWHFKAAQEACNEFREGALSKEEKVQGIPKIKVVEASRIPRIPGDNWEIALGEGYASNPLN